MLVKQVLVSYKHMYWGIVGIRDIRIVKIVVGKKKRIESTDKLVDLSILS